MKILFLVQSNDCNLILIYICTNILELSLSWEAWNWKWNFTVCSKQPFILKYVFQTCKKCVSIGPFVCTLLSIIFRLLHSALYKSYVYKYCKKKNQRVACDLNVILRQTWEKSRLRVLTGWTDIPPFSSISYYKHVSHFLCQPGTARKTKGKKIDCVS